MRINFNKTQKGYDSLKNFFNEKGGEYQGTDGTYIVPLDFDSKKFRKSFFGELEKTISDEGYKFIKNKDFSLWAYEPESFKLKLGSPISGLIGFEQIREKESKYGIFNSRSKIVPVVRESYKVEIDGEIYFAELDDTKVKIGGILKALDNLGYECETITTLEDLKSLKGFFGSKKTRSLTFDSVFGAF